MKKIAVYTLGCKVNQYDTESMLESFERAGYQPVPIRESADVYLINTCTVTGTGDTKSEKMIRRCARQNPDCSIIVAGCLAQRASTRLLEMDNVRLVIGIQSRAKVVRLLEEAIETDTRINAVGSLKNAEFEPLFVSRHEGKTRATMKIQEGCDRWCTYCIIPAVRGPVRSMKLQAVRDEAVRLGEAGYREIVVTGIHMASYGRESGDKLIDAIRVVHDAPGVERVRIGSLEPVTVTEEFARELSEMPGLMRQFHLSLQSGSATVLERMRRRYTPEEYLRACETLRGYMPDCAITTDVISGFPGETEAEFQETLDFIRKARLARIHAFPYSRRSGTVADRMDGQVSEEVKHIRNTRLIEVGNELEQDFVKGIVGTVQSVLFETSVEDGLSEGYTGQYVRVRAAAAPGEICNVRITHAEGTLAYGEIEETTGGEKEMDCLFCKIIAGEIPSNKVYEDEKVMAFRDVNPQAPVHVLIVPKKHMSNILECDAETAAALVNGIQKVAEIEGVTESGFRVLSNCGSDGCQSVGHLHIHLLGGKKLSEKMD